MKQLSTLRTLAFIMLGSLPIALFAQQPRIANWRPYDKTGINVFETSKTDTVAYDGLKVRFGAGFTQQFQNLKASNTALNNTGTGANRLVPLKPGFMTAQAILTLMLNWVMVSH